MQNPKDKTNGNDFKNLATDDGCDENSQILMFNVSIKANKLVIHGAKDVFITE